MNRAKKRQLDKIIYRLKRSFGQRMHVRKLIRTVRNSETGKIERDYRTIVVNHGIVLPRRMSRDFAYDLSFIAANKNFTYGAHYDQNDRDVIIEAKDIPSDLVITNDDYMLIADKQYRVREVMEPDDDTFFVIKLRRVTGQEAIDHVS